MGSMRDQSVNQGRWNQYGLERQKEIEHDPDSYNVSDYPLHRQQFYIRCRELYSELMGLIDPIQDKRILEVGCGRGDFSVWLAKQGARVTAVDIGADLVAAARDLARLNQVDCELRQGNVTDLAFAESNTYDAVIGIAILHHLTEADVSEALQECHRVLKTGGTAVFYEPVENSQLFNFVQNLFPVGRKGSGRYRPSILQRTAWTKYVETLDDRSMTNRELVLAGKALFSTIRVSPHGFLVRLTRLVGKSRRNTLVALDKLLFKYFPPLKHYNQKVLVEYRK